MALEALAGSTLQRLVFFAQDQETYWAIAYELRNVAPRERRPAWTESPALETHAPEDKPSAPPIYSTVDLAGGMSSDLVDPNIGIPLSRDQLDFAPYVSMLATVIADPELPPNGEVDAVSRE